MTLPSTAVVDAPASSAEIEASHVHEVYNQIATHFSNTRYAPWPVVRDFLVGRAPGSVGLDIGCGNGKYLNVNRDIFIVGSDRSEGLCEIAASRGHEIVLCDGQATPHPLHRFDFVICIAVVHHYASLERRRAAIQHILSLLVEPASSSSSSSPSSLPSTSMSAGGCTAEALIYVWALEQKTSRRGWDGGDPQDIMVPWKTQDEQGKEVVYERYYHLYKKGDLEADVLAVRGHVVRSGYDKDNWWVVIRNA